MRLLQRQVEEAFRDNRMIAVCQYNAMPGEDMMLLRHYLRKHNIEVKFFLNEVGAELLGLVPVWQQGEGAGAFLKGGKQPLCSPESSLLQIIRPVLSQSKYRNLLPLFVARNILLVSREVKAKEMLRVLKGVPQINLLGESIPCALAPVGSCIRVH